MSLPTIGEVACRVFCITQGGLFHAAQCSRSAVFHEDNEIVFRHACKLGLEGIVLKRKGSPLRPLARLAQDEEPRRACGEARGGRGLGAGRALMPPGNPVSANTLKRQVGG